MANAQVVLSLRGRLLIGGGMIAFGLIPMLATFDIGPLGPEDVNGPAWLGLASGGAIAAGGLAFLAGQERPIVSGLLALLVLLGLAAIGNWIAFGVGARTCDASIALWSGPLEGLGCRIPFGIGALITNAIVVLCAVTTLQTAVGGPPRLARARRGAEILMFFSLAPIILPVIVVLFVRIAFDAVKIRLTTGQWPRNEKFIARQRAKQNKDP